MPRSVRPSCCPRSGTRWRWRTRSRRSIGWPRVVSSSGWGGFPGPDTRREFEVLGGDYGRRVEALDAAVATMRDVWSTASRPAPTGVTVLPPPVRPAGPPVWLAAATPPGLDRCARTYDGWLPYPVTAGDYSAGWQVVRTGTEAARRAPGDVVPALYVTVAIGEGAEPHDRLDRYCGAYYGAPRELVGMVQAMVSGSLDDVAGALWRYVEAGCRHLVIRHGTFDREALRDEAGRLHEHLRSMWCRLG